MACDPYAIRHRPVVLLEYESHDGQYANDTDTHWLSIGFSTYEPHAVSAKAIRVVVGKSGQPRISRLSEELPIHRVCDLVLLLAESLEAVSKGDAKVVFTPDMLENQPARIELEIKTQSPQERNNFRLSLEDNMVRRRLHVLGDTLQRMILARII